MDQQARGIDFEIFALNVKRLAVGADAVAPPFASGPDVHGGFGYVVQAGLPPPLRELGGIADGLEDAGRRSSDEDFGDDGILVRGDGFGCHLKLLSSLVTDLATNESESQTKVKGGGQECPPHIGQSLRRRSKN